MFTCLPWSGICCSAGKAVTVAADKSVGVIQSYSGWRVEASCSLLRMISLRICQVLVISCWRN